MGGYYGVPMSKRPSPTAELMRKVEEAGGQLRIEFDSDSAVTRFEFQVRAAHRFHLVPSGKRVYLRWWGALDREIRLVDEAIADAWERDQATARAARLQRAMDAAAEGARAEIIRDDFSRVLRERSEAWAARQRHADYVAAMETLAEDESDGVRAASAHEWVEWARGSLAESDVFAEFLSMPPEPKYLRQLVHASVGNIRRPWLPEWQRGGTSGDGHFS